MMDVQRMRHMVDEVEQGALPEVVQAAARRWCGPGEVSSLRYVRSSANHLFRFLQDGQPRYLRLAHAAERHPSAIAAELDFVHHVAHTGLTVARPMASAHGRLIEDVSGQGQQYWAVVFAGLHGREFECDELDEGGYRAWGRALALVHRASQTFPPHPARPDWRDELRAALRTLPAEETAVAQMLASGLRWLDALALQDQDYGLLHGDFELDNLLWDGEQVQALDFDEAVYAWYLVDFAAALQDVWLAGDTRGVTSKERITWFTQGYATLRPLPDGLWEAMPRLLTLVLALKVARLLRAYATTSDGGSPAWLAQMRTAHHQWLQAKRAVLIRE
jgi:Ser/Thr protein kinase RdoA (MazF antagonist)